MSATLSDRKGNGVLGLQEVTAWSSQSFSRGTAEITRLYFYLP